MSSLRRIAATVKRHNHCTTKLYQLIPSQWAKCAGSINLHIFEYSEDVCVVARARIFSSNHAPPENACCLTVW